GGTHRYPGSLTRRGGSRGDPQLIRFASLSGLPLRLARGPLLTERATSSLIEMVGLVVVSHSSRLAEGVVELAREMGGATVAIEAAGGLEAGGALGTSATMIAAAIERAWSEEGVLVLMDLGSAVLSAEAALELLGGDRGERVVLSDGPLAEGAVIAAVAAAAGSSLAEVADQARRALEPKSRHLDRR